MDYGFYGPTGPMALLAGVQGCAGFLVAILLIVVGFVTVRAALPNAGYMVGAAGALQLLAVCCSSWQQGAAMSGAGYDLLESFGGISATVALFFHLVSIALVVAGAVFLSLELTKRRDAAPASGPVSSPVTSPGAP